MFPWADAEERNREVESHTQGHTADGVRIGIHPRLSIKNPELSLLPCAVGPCCRVSKDLY